MPTITELGQRVKAKYPGTYDDLPDDELGQRVKARYPGSYDDFVDSGPQLRATPSLAQRLGNQATAALPTAGGAIGGLVGGVGGGVPGAVVGAMLGGTVGRTAQDVITGRSSDPFLSGAEQGAYEIAGQGLARGAAGVAKPLMRRALGVGKSILRDFPGASETALSKGIAISEGGAAKATRLRQESARALNDLLTQARAQGAMLNTRRVLRPVRDLLRSNVIPDEEKSAIMQKLVSFLGDKTARMDPLLLKEIKQFYQNRATSAYRAARIGGMTEAQAPAAGFSRALASGARQQLETIPGVAQREATTQSLIGAERAVRDAVMRPPSAFEFHRPGTFPIVRSLYGPYVQGQVARMLNSQLFRQVARQSPRAAAALIMDLTNFAEPDVTSQ